MIVEMDMSSGQKIIELREDYGDEVLLANWLPQPELQLGLQEVATAKPQGALDEARAEAFLRNVYRFQE